MLNPKALLVTTVPRGEASIKARPRALRDQRSALPALAVVDPKAYISRCRKRQHPLQ